MFPLKLLLFTLAVSVLATESKFSPLSSLKLPPRTLNSNNQASATPPQNTGNELPPTFLSSSHQQQLFQGKEVIPIQTQVGAGKGWKLEGYDPKTFVSKMRAMGHGDRGGQDKYSSPDPPGYQRPNDSDMDKPEPHRLGHLYKKLDQVLGNLWVNASYDPKMDAIPDGECEWFAEIFTTYLPDFPGDGGFEQANLHNVMGFTQFPGSINGIGSLVWWFWMTGVVRDDVIDPVTGEDIWPRWAVNNLTQWKVQLVNRTMPFRPKVDGRSGNIMYPRRCVTDQLVPIGTGNNGGGTSFLVHYGRRAEKIVKWGADLVWPSNPAGELNPTWGFAEFDSRNTTNLPLRSRVLHERVMADYILQQNANVNNKFRYNTFNPKVHFHVGHSFGDASGKINHAGEVGYELAPHPFWEAPIYFGGIDGTPESQFNTDMAKYNWTGIMLLTGNTAPDPQLPRALPQNKDKVGSAYVLVPKCYHQWCGEPIVCAFSVLAQVLGVDVFMSGMLPGWFLDTCVADKSLWVNTLFDPVPIQEAQDLNNWMDSRLMTGFGLLARDDPGFVGQLVPVGQQNSYFHYILSVDQLYAAQGSLLPPAGESLCYSGLHNCGSYQFQNVTTPAQTARAMHFHRYYASSSSYSGCDAYATYLYSTSFSTRSGENYGPIITNAPTPTFIWATQVETECGIGIKYRQPSTAELAANSACNYPS